MPSSPGCRPPAIVLVTGVSGSGKTTIGRLLAERLGWDYAEADDFHPPGNIAKMRAGQSLTDANRMPWLQAIAAWIDKRVATGKPAVVSCSALKRRYRDLLRRPQLRIAFLDGDRDLIARRMAARKGHFFPTALLDSQFRDLEPPTPDEGAVVVSVAGTPEQAVQQIIDDLGPVPAGRSADGMKPTSAGTDSSRAD